MLTFNDFIDLLLDKAFKTSPSPFIPILLADKFKSTMTSLADIADAIISEPTSSSPFHDTSKTLRQEFSWTEKWDLLKLCKKKNTLSVKNLRYILCRHTCNYMYRNTSSPLAIAFAPFGPNPFQLMLSVSIVSLLPTIKVKKNKLISILIKWNRPVFERIT